MQQVSERPLTVIQKGRLLFDCLPFLFLLPSTIFVLTIWRDLTVELTGQRQSPWLAPVLGVGLLYTGWIAFQRVRDVVAGSAVVAEDRLLRLWRGRSRGQRRCYGNFARLGLLRVWPPEWNRNKTEFELGNLSALERSSLAEDGQSDELPRYRVTYSPASKIVWSLERIGD